MKKILLSLIIVLCVVSCSSDEPTLNGSIDRVGEEIRVTVHFHDDNTTIRQLYALTNNISYRNTSPNLKGFAIWHEWSVEPMNVEYECIIHTLRPRRIDDDNTLTLGHELLHCLYGTYHP
jgi:hypothetical protein